MGAKKNRTYLSVDNLAVLSGKNTCDILKVSECHIEILHKSASPLKSC